MSRPEFFEPLSLIPLASPFFFAGSPISTLTNAEFEHDDAYDANARLFGDFEGIQFSYEPAEAELYEGEIADEEDAEEDETGESCIFCEYALVVGERVCCTDCRRQMRPEERIWLL